MKKQIILLLTIVLFFTACKNDKTTDDNSSTAAAISNNATLINLMTFEDEDIPNGKNYEYTVTFRFFLQDQNGKNIFSSPNTIIKDFNSDKNSLLVDFSKITGVEITSKDQSIRYELEIERKDAANSQVDKITLPETQGSKLTTFDLSDYLKELGGNLNDDNKNNITTQKIKFEFKKKAGGSLPGSIQPPIKPIVIP